MDLCLEIELKTEGDSCIESVEEFQFVGDPSKLTQILRNSASNALRVCPKGGKLSIYASRHPGSKASMDHYLLSSGRHVTFPRHGMLSVAV